MQLKILAVKPDGSTEAISDYIGQNSYLASSYDDGQYLFDITYYVQEIINGSIENDGFYIMSNNDYNSPARVIIKGSKNSNPVKLSLTLRKIK